MGIFRKKLPIVTSWKSLLKMALAFGIFVTVFLLVFKPFKLDTLASGKLITASLIYGLITGTCIFCTCMILPRLFPSLFIEDAWTTGKQIIYVSFIVVLVGFVNYLISPFIVRSSYSMRNILWFQGVSLAVALLPISISILFKQNQLLKQFERQAAILEKKLQEKLEQEEKNQVPDPSIEKKTESTGIVLIGDYQSEKITLQPEDLYFITSANNYVKVFFSQREKVSYSIVRMTMKKAEEALEAWPAFFRCHRAYIVNLDKVQHVEGNAQGYKIRLTDVEDPIPISRSLNNEFSDKLLALRNNNTA